MASSTLPTNNTSRFLNVQSEATPVLAEDQCGSLGLHDEVLEGTRDQTASATRPARGRLSRSLFRMGSAPESAFFWPPIAEEATLPTSTGKYAFGKRAFDLLLAVLILPPVALVLLLIAAVIVVSSGWPVFYRQRRVGRGGREFYIWKFRTMRIHGDRILREHLKRNAAARLEWQHTHKLRNDPRITRVGKLLRKTSLDELPQILNVLSGDMSFVGPRPIVEAETAKYADRLSFYLAAVPGITGLWQVSGRCNVSYSTRVILDETYVRKWSLLRDLLILLKTPKAVFCRHGAY